MSDWINMSQDELERLREHADGMPRLCQSCEKFMTENVPPICDNCDALIEDAFREMVIDQGLEDVGCK